ncbi:MAG: S-layer homology domain-containing protein [Proteocatella sp.]
MYNLKKIVSVTCLLFLFQGILFQEKISYGAETIYNNHWANKSVENLKKENILTNDISPKKFSIEILNQPITREEVFSLAVKSKRLEIKNKEMPFLDKNKISKNFLSYMSTAYSQGLLNGEERGKGLYCRPLNNITRQEACAVIAKVYELEYFGEEVNFSDKDSIASWSMPGVATLSRSGAISGYADGSFRPNSSLTRGEAYAVFSSLQEKYYRDNKVVIYAGDAKKAFKNGALDNSSFSAPTKITGDSNGNLYITDSGNNMIRQISDESVSTFSGGRGILDNNDNPIGGYLDTTREKSFFNVPSGIIKINQNVFISDRKNHVLRLINGDNVYTFAGNGKEGFKDGEGNNASFSLPGGMALGEDDKIYVADTGNNAIRVVDKLSKVVTLAGNKEGFSNGKCEEATFYEPEGLAFFNDTLYVADTGNNAIRIIKDGEVSTLAGGKNHKDEFGVAMGDYLDGKAEEALFSSPMDIAVATDGTVYVADTGNSMIRVIKDGQVSTLVGLGEIGKYLEKPTGLYISENNLFVADSFKNQILKISLGNN